MIRNGIISKDCMDEIIHLYNKPADLDRKFQKYEDWARQKFGIRKVRVLVLDGTHTRATVEELRRVADEIERELRLQSDKVAKDIKERPR